MSVKQSLNQNQWSSITAVILLLAILSACDARTSVRGTVADADGKPVAGAEVRLVSLKSGRSDVTQTDEEGAFICGITHGPAAGKFEFMVSKAGFAPFRKEVEERAELSEKIVLIRESESAKPGGEPKPRDPAVFP